MKLNRVRSRRGPLLSVGLILGVMSLFATNVSSAVEAPVGLGTTESFAVLAGSGVTNTGPTVIRGSVGTCPTPAITGFPPGTVLEGTIHAADAVCLQAQSDLTIAYDDAAGRAPTTTYPGVQDLGGPTPLTPGVYKATAFAITGTLTLDAQGDPNAVWIFQSGSTLITEPNSRVVLINGAQPCNVFWQVGSSATLGVGSTFVGTILALTSITANTNATVQGRLLARNGAVTLDSNTVTRPVCAPTPTTTSSTTSSSTTIAPTTTSSTTIAPTTTSSTIVPPITVPPVTVPPVTVPPITVPPVTLAPTTLPPVTLPPTTLPVVTVPPVTVPPVTTPPVLPPDVTLPPVDLPDGMLPSTTTTTSTALPVTTTTTSLAPAPQTTTTAGQGGSTGVVDTGGAATTSSTTTPAGTAGGSSTGGASSTTTTSAGISAAAGGVTTATTGAGGGAAGASSTGTLVRTGFPMLGPGLWAGVALAVGSGLVLLGRQDNPVRRRRKFQRY